MQTSKHMLRFISNEISIYLYKNNSKCTGISGYLARCGYRKIECMTDSCFETVNMLIL